MAQRGRGPLRRRDDAALLKDAAVAFDVLVRVERRRGLVLFLGMRAGRIGARSSDHVSEAFQRPRYNLVRGVRQAPLDAREQESLARRSTHELTDVRDVLEEGGAERPRAVVEAGDEQRDEEIVRVGSAKEPRELIRAR